MRTNLWTTALLLGVATSTGSGMAFGRDNPLNKNSNNAARAGNANQTPRISQLGNQGAGRASQNQVRNQIQNQQQNQQQFRQNLNQQTIQRQPQVNQQLNQNRNLINQHLNHAQQQQNQLNQAPKIQQPNQNPVLNQRSNQFQNQLNQNQKQLNQNLQNFGQNNTRPGSNTTPFSKPGGQNLGNANGLQGGAGNLTQKPPINQNSDKQNQIRNQIQQRQQQLQNQGNVSKNLNNKNLNQPLTNLNPSLQQKLNSGKNPNLGNQNSLNSALHKHNQNSNHNGVKSLNPQHLEHLQKQIHHNQTVGLNNLANNKKKIVGGKGFTPLYAVGHNNHHHSGIAQHQHIANKLNFGKGQIYLGKSNYQPSFHHHPHAYKGYWNLYGNNFAGGHPYGSYRYLPYFWGLGGWGLGSMAYGCGYTQYYNPYYVVTPTTIVYDYAQPIPVAYNDQIVSVDPNEGATTDEILGSAIAAFKQNSYDQALDLVNSGIAKNPDDAVLHEFRALVLFAKGDYQQAAATVHSVLAVGPGWDWTTLSGMYSDVGIYTIQLRALEAAAKANPDDAASRFLLAYHYMSDGYPDAAASQLQKVVALVPNDQVSANLLKMLTPQNPPQNAPATNDDTQPQPGPGIDLPSPDPVDEAPAAPIDPAMIQGEWKASRDDGSTFGLKLTGNNSFTWTFAPKQQPSQSFEGKYTLEGNTIALEREGGGSMVAELTRNDDSSFNFKMVGAPDEDPGLNFVR